MSTLEVLTQVHRGEKSHGEAESRRWLWWYTGWWVVDVTGRRHHAESYHQHVSTQQHTHNTTSSVFSICMEPGWQ